ncbi:MAG: hypothetical protein H3C43_02825 [Leptonema sp. (in: Bacteria)]|nr:hypothetical protein [Leptonema sp. (in: bacteria)]
MKLKSLFWVTMSLWVSSQCSPSITSVRIDSADSTDNDQIEDSKGFVDNQPLEPVKSDDLYFQKPAQPGELYRVLITGTNYSVRQYGLISSIIRPADSRGDQEQLKSYQEVHEQIDFKNWDIEGALEVKLNPHTGQIEQLQYVPNQTPNTWQAAKLFQEDLTRYRFKFPQGTVTPVKFQVSFRWVINRRPGLNDEEARQRAIEFLRTQTR